MVDDNTLKEGGVLAVLFALFVNVFHKKDVQQNNQNDLLVQNLIESNNSKDEHIKILITELKEISGEFTKCMKLMTEELKGAKQDLAEIKELVKSGNQRN